jgi:predicted nucleic acid-binding protein
MRIAIDTNRYTDLCRGDPEVIARVEQAERVLLPFIVLAELRAGFAVGRKGAENASVLGN